MITQVSNRALKMKQAKARLLLAQSERCEFREEIEACEGSLSAFIKASWHVIEPGAEYKHNYHIDAISEYLEAVTAGQIKRLLINMPPRYMKSITVSVDWPVWEWLRRPEMRAMFAAYSASLSVDEHAFRRRQIIQSEWFQQRWGRRIVLIRDQLVVMTNSRLGCFEATSFSGTATGKGGNRVIVDDPHNPKKAESDLERKLAVKLFDTTLSTRLNDKKEDAIVVVMQRLHQEDVSARCLELEYTHLCLPAESEGRTAIVFPISGREVVREDGDLLWPEREGPEEIQSAQTQLGPYGYAGQYQQRPAPLGGGMFTDFEIVHAYGANAKFVRYWDKAGTQNGGAYTAGVLMARSPEGVYTILDIVRGRWSASEREKIIKSTAEMDRAAYGNVHIWCEQEPGSGGKESAENTIKMLAGFPAFKEPVTGDKETRAMPFAAQSQVANVKLMQAHWNKPFVEEARMFPNGSFKDQIDAASGAFNKLVLAARPAQGGAKPPGTLPPVPTSLKGNNVTIPGALNP